MSANEETIGLAEAAALLLIPYQDAHRLLLTGRLRGQKRGGRWFVVLQDVEAVGRSSSKRPKVGSAFEGR